MHGKRLRNKIIKCQFLKFAIIIITMGTYAIALPHKTKGRKTPVIIF